MQVGLLDAPSFGGGDDGLVGFVGVTSGGGLEASGAVAVVTGGISPVSGAVAPGSGVVSPGSGTVSPGSGVVATGRVTPPSAFDVSPFLRQVFVGTLQK